MEDLVGREWISYECDEPILRAQIGIDGAVGDRWT